MPARPTTLYLHGDVSAHLAAGAVEVEGSTVPFDVIEAVVVFSPARLSTPLVLALADADISVAWLTKTGALRTRTSAGLHGSVERLVAQVGGSMDPARCLGLAKSVVVGRLKSMAASLARGAGEGRQPQLLGAAATSLRHLEREASECSELGSLRLMEAAGASTYWSAFGALLLNPAFSWGGRSRRPPGDPLNALISFLSVLWTNRCEGALGASGLDPRLGFLHVIRPGRASLACDLVEEFRAWGPERESLALLNLGQVRPTHFDAVDNGVYLNDAGRSIVLSAHHRRLAETVRHPDRAAAVPAGILPAIQAERLARALVDGEAYRSWQS